MRGAALFVVLAIARALALIDQPIAWSPWLPPALLWHDVLIGVVFWIVDRISRESRWMWVPYGAIVAWAALNVPVVRALSSPLTWPMLRAAGGPLADSIAYYATTANLLAIGVVLAAGAAGPAIVRALRPAWRSAGVIAVLAIAALGPIASAQVDTRGLDRNAVTAIATSIWPRMSSRAGDDDWRASPFGARIVGDLTRHRGAGSGRNVVLVVLESTAAQYLRPYGAADDPMPNLSALASQSIVFERAYAAYPESIKGLFATLCSRFPAFDVSVEEHVAAPCVSLTRLLADAGYRTGIFHSGRFAYLGMAELVERQRFDVARDAGAIGGVVQSSFGVDEASTVRNMLGWIDEQPRDRPFFLTYLPAAGHHPYATSSPGPFAGDNELAAYKNALFEGDASLGAFIDGLRARKLDGNTLMVVIGDHGEAFGQHPGNAGHTIFIYDENVRVPLLVSMPGVTTEPVRIARTASVIDVAPTILDLLGIALPSAHQGASLLTPRDRLALFYTDYSLGWLGLRDNCWKYMFETRARRDYLFDVCADPGEQIDRSAAEPARVAAYRERVERWSSATRAGIGR